MQDDKKPDRTKVHSRARTEFNQVQMAQRDERMQCLQDRRFYSIAGAQWEDSLGEQFANLPRFELNKIHKSVIRIISEYRNNRIAVSFLPKDGCDPKISDVLNGLYRADVEDSNGDEAHDNAFEESVGGGIGAWRLRAVMEDEYDDENDHQRIRIEPIFDADSCVFWDLNAKRADKTDAKRCWVLTAYTVEGYMEEFNDNPASWPHDISLSYFDWATESTVFVAEYYEVEDVSTKYIYLTGLQDDVIKLAEDDYVEVTEELAATGYEVTRERIIKERKIHKYIMSGNGILRDDGIIAGKYIPIVPKYGKRWYVDSIERCMGHVRLAKDAQRLKNMNMSMLGRIATLSPVEKPIFTPEQMAGHQVMWSEDNIENYPYLLTNPITDSNGQTMPAGPIGYTKPPNLPPALAAILATTDQDMADMLGNDSAMEKMPANLAEGTLEMVQSHLDMQGFIYIDNQAKSMNLEGRIWLSMAKELYIEPGRKMKTVAEHGDRSTVTLMKPMANKDTSDFYYENDLSTGDFDVIVDVGASFTSRKKATVAALTNLLKMAAMTDPNQASLLLSAILMNTEGEGLEDIREFYRNKLLQMGVIKPTDEEAAELAKVMEAEANKPPDANTIYLQKAAEKEEALAKKAGADTIKTLSDAEKTQAETQKIMQELTPDQQREVLDLMNSLLSMGQQAQQLEQAIQMPAQQTVQ